MKSGRLTLKQVAALRSRMVKLDWDCAALAFHSHLNQTTVWRVLERKHKAQGSTMALIIMALKEGERDAQEAKTA